MSELESSDKAVVVSKVDETVSKNLPEFHVNQGEDSFMSQNVPESPSCSTCGQKTERLEYLQKIRSSQKQRLLARTRRIMGLPKENQNLKKV